MEYYHLKTPYKFKKPILALGADMKANFCLAQEQEAHLFIPGGDLGEVGVFNNYRKEIQKALRQLEIKPAVVAYDLHPGYFSSRFALTLSAPQKIAVQHHHAHIVSSSFENGITEKVIGVAFDGTGYGDDANIWGSEFLLSDYKGYERLGHLKYIPLIGGDMATREIWRVSCAWLYFAFGKDFLKLKIDFVKRINKNTWRVFERMLKEKINCPFTSGIGRLFDSVAALIGLRDKVNYEAQAAIELEKAAEWFQSQEGFDIKRKLKGYEFEIENSEGRFVVNPLGMFRGIVRDLRDKVSREKIAFKFHYTVSRIVIEVCLKINNRSGIRKAVLSGGVFQNKILNSLVTEMLNKEKFAVLRAKKFPVHDGSLSLGQAVIANTQCG